MARSINEILKQADSTSKLQTLIDLWNEIANNKYKYTLVNIRFAREYIMELTLKADGSDIDKAKFWIALNKQSKHSKT